MMWILLVTNVVMIAVGVVLLVAGRYGGLTFIVTAAILIWVPILALRRMRREAGER